MTTVKRAQLISMTTKHETRIYLYLPLSISLITADMHKPDTEKVSVNALRHNNTFNQPALSEVQIFTKGFLLYLNTRFPILTPTSTRSDYKVLGLREGRVLVDYSIHFIHSSHKVQWELL
jgi:hypothetical protein